MKKIFCFLLLLLIGCAPVDKRRSRENYPSVETNAFEYSQQCAHLCWLGINPGITTKEEAGAILRASNRIDQKTFHRSDDGIETFWFFEKTKTLKAEVLVSFESGLVKSIQLTNLIPFILNDFVEILGAPDEISIDVGSSPHGEELITYDIYYHSKIIVSPITRGEWNGPDPNDYVSMIFLNTENTVQDRQPWLGYGHLQEYLPGQNRPANANRP